MPTPRILLISALAPLLLGCAGALPVADPAIARLPAAQLARLSAETQPGLPLAELVRLSRAGVTDAELIVKIRAANAHYALGAAQLIDLHQQGVSTGVLDYLQSAREQELRDSLADDINQREARHAAELQRERELQRSGFYCDPAWPAYPGSLWHPGFPAYPYGGFYWRR